MDENNYNQQQGNQYNPQPEPQYTQQPGQYANQQNQYNAQQYYAQQPPFGNQYNQPPVQQPRQVPFTQIFNPPYDPTTQVMSVGEYIGLFILSSIPVVNIICWIVWLCSDSTNKNKKNYIKANIVIWVLSVVLLVLFYVFIFSVYGTTFLDF